MKERPVIFSAPMVRALLLGTKTQTRRTVKPQPTGYQAMLPKRRLGANGVTAASDQPGCAFAAGDVRCPYGQPGDRLFVKEAFRFAADFDQDTPSGVADRCVEAGCRKPWAPIQYEADGSRANWEHTSTLPQDATPKAGRARSPIHLPRWASRITLEITEVRVERLQDISEADAMAEGVCRLADGGFGLQDGAHYDDTDPRESYLSLFESINGPGSVDANPWVWAVTFETVT